MQSTTFGEKQIQHVRTNTSYSFGGLMIWASSAATGPGHLGVIERAMDSSEYHSVPESTNANAWPELGNATVQ